jgi:hypothetical protein
MVHKTLQLISFCYNNTKQRAYGNVAVSLFILLLIRVLSQLNWWIKKRKSFGLWLSSWCTIHALRFEISPVISTWYR